MKDTTYRVVQQQQDEEVLIEDSVCPVRAFQMAAEHNRALGVDETPRAPYIVLRGNHQVYG